MPKHPGRTALYRLYDKAGDLLYIGISHKPDVRWGQHSEDKEWWPGVERRAVEWHETRFDAERAELAAIALERPRHNVLGTPLASVTSAGGKTPPRQVRIGDTWYDFEAAAKAMGTERAAVIRELIDWYIREPGAKLPARPERSVVEEARTARSEGA